MSLLWITPFSLPLSLSLHSKSPLFLSQRRGPCLGPYAVDPQQQVSVGLLESCPVLYGAVNHGLLKQDAVTCSLVLCSATEHRVDRQMIRWESLDVQVREGWGTRHTITTTDPPHALIEIPIFHVINN